MVASIGVVALLVAVRSDLAGPGGLLIGAIAVYTIGRQALFQLRAEPRRTTSGRPLTIIVAAIVLAIDIVLLAASSTL